MWKGFFIFVFISIAFTVIQSQNISVKSSAQLTYDAQGAFYYPKFTPDGKKVFFSAANFAGLYYMELSKGKLVKFNDYYGAGYGFAFSRDSKNVYFRINRFENRRKLSSLLTENLSNKKIKYLVKDKKDLSTPLVTKNGNCVYTNSGEVTVLNSTNKKLSRVQIKKTNPVVLIENQNLILFRNGKKNVLNPLGNGNYIWPSLSADGKKILFTFAGDASYICDLNGNVLVNLGWANAPQWSPDGNWIAYMIDKSDGHNFTSSDIWAVTSDGKNKVQLTFTDDQIELYPDWSPAGDKIVYHTLNGNVHMLNLNVTK
ncbi:MAG: hypothetical protein NTX22_13830 [Ignavibacteriales bacterium]|nr:hypothetical protein [Ignavibacteriales bacterium]